MTLSARAVLLLACGLAVPMAALAQTRATPALAAPSAGPPWSSLTSAQRAALAPLERDWPNMDANRKQKWLDIAARLPTMPPDERQRIQQRMTEWARMTPQERGRARLQFQQARQISPQQRQARWDAYMALPPEERRALAESATKVPQTRKPGPNEATPKPVAPTLLQAKPGASTTLISKTANPPAHVKSGGPKITTDQDEVSRRTLLPKATRREGGAASAP